jgi:protein-disulfide isomerase
MANQPPKSGATPPSRRDRREAARRDRRLAAARTTSAKPAWQSPMVLLSVGAVVAGLVIILLASGVLGGRGNGGTADDLLIPIRPTPTELVAADDPRALATGNAPVTVEVWSDYQCPACGLWARTIEPDVIEELVKPGTVRLVYRDMAFIDGGNPNGESQQSAAASRCAGEQDAFWPYHDYLYENQDGENDGAFRRERLDLIASTLGLDMDAFGSCLDGDAAVQAVAAETAQGRQAGVSSTPTIAVNGVLQAPGALSLEDVRTAVENALAASSPVP